jgi:hypothetical protein
VGYLTTEDAIAHVPKGVGASFLAKYLWQKEVTVPRSVGTVDLAAVKPGSDYLGIRNFIGLAGCFKS